VTRYAPERRIDEPNGVNDATLHALARAGGPASTSFARLTRLATQHYRTELGLVSLLDGERLWCQASDGRELLEVEPSASFAAPILARPDELLVVPDTLEDPRFVKHPWVTGEPGVRFLLAAPVIVPTDGRAVGTLAVLDPEQRPRPGNDELAVLRDLAALVSDALVAHQRRRDVDAARAELVRLAASDPLTGLLNRRAVFDRMEAAVALARRTGHGLAVALLDLDKFKAVNDRYGHGVGDGLLLQVATALERASREHDLVARMGGDEFVLLWQALRPEGAMIAAERTWRAVTQPYRITDSDAPGTTVLELGASLGVACFPEDAEDAVGLLRAADVAMYQAKRAGGGVARFETTP
jgi:diguanylate cyclase